MQVSFWPTNNNWYQIDQQTIKMYHITQDRQFSSNTVCNGVRDKLTISTNMILFFIFIGQFDTIYSYLNILKS